MKYHWTTALKVHRNLGILPTRAWNNMINLIYLPQIYWIPICTISY